MQKHRLLSFFINFAPILTTECLVNLFKNKNNEKKTGQCECAVHAFQHTLLRLPYNGKRA